MGKASRAKKERRELTGEEIEAAIKKRDADRAARVKRADERLRLIEKEEQVVLVYDCQPVPRGPNAIGGLTVVAERLFVPKEMIREGVPPEPAQPTAE